MITDMAKFLKITKNSTLGNKTHHTRSFHYNIKQIQDNKRIKLMELTYSNNNLKKKFNPSLKTLATVAKVYLLCFDSSLEHCHYSRLTRSIPVSWKWLRKNNDQFVKLAVLPKNKIKKTIPLLLEKSWRHIRHKS